MVEAIEQPRQHPNQGQSTGELGPQVGESRQAEKNVEKNNLFSDNLETERVAINY